MPQESPKIDEIKDYYDSVYYAHGSQHDDKSLRRHYLRLFRRLNIQPGNKVLDVACGSGTWLRICSEAGTEVSGVDLSDKAIDICKNTLPQGAFFAQPAEELPFEDGVFDVVTCLGSLEHFVEPERSLREMIRVAKQGAVFVILVPNEDFLTRRLGLFRGTGQVDAREVVRTLQEWDALFRRAGLAVEERWRDLHILNWDWIGRGPIYTWPLRALQAISLVVWPLRWQYQVYHRCSAPAPVEPALERRET
jgi:ubiquinone/menaquinone biosynthesis C-methylase UbiE